MVFMLQDFRKWMKFEARGELWIWEPILMGTTAQDLLRDFLKSPKGVQRL